MAAHLSTRVVPATIGAAPLLWRVRLSDLAMARQAHKEGEAEMTTLTLDRELKEVDWDDKHYPRPQIKAEVEKGCLSNNAVVSDYRAKMKTETEVVFASTVPDNAALYHKNYLGYLARTFAHHNSIVMAPQHFWYTILCEIAQTVVRNPEEHRKIFTRDPEGKIDIIVPCEDETEPLRMDDIYAEMVGLVPVDTELFLPTFSTETEMSRLAFPAAFLETCSPFYNYMMYLCGHPQIKLLGTKADWELVIDRLDHLTGEFAACPDSQLPMWLNESVFPTALKLRKALDGDDPEWFKTIFTQERCGSGGETQIDGWFCRLMMQQPDGK